MINDNDLRLIILGCFRYSLGRRNYMPSTVVNVILSNRHLFNKTDWIRFVEEINDCDNLGDSCDIETWNRLREYAVAQLNEGKKNGN